MDVRWFFSFLCLAHIVICEEVVFPSGLRLTVEDPASAAGGAAKFTDDKETGAMLFNGGGDNEDEQLAMHVPIRLFKSADSDFFRAHPQFVSCLKDVINGMQNDRKPVEIESGYKTKSDIGVSSDPKDLYASGGTGAILKFRSEVTDGDVKDIAKLALKYCVVMFEEIKRDIGLILMAGKLHIHMTGANDLGPTFSAESGADMSSADFKIWVQEQINAGLDPVQTADCCDNYQGIDQGTMFPPDVSSAEEAVGSVDTPITRDTPEDFDKLQQYFGTNIDFGPKIAASWCGKEGISCVDCSTQFVGNHQNSRCAVRLMQPRMYNILRVLQKLTREAIAGNKLKVTKSFVEPYQGQTDYDATSLHVEGRMLVLEVTPDNTPANLKTVSKFAKALGVDFMKHDGSSLVLAVQKMKGRTPMTKNFADNRLIAADPPHAKKSLYSLPKEFPEDEEITYPLYYKKGQENAVIATLITDVEEEKPTVAMFASRDSEFDYFRLHPLVPECYSNLMWQYNKALEEGENRTVIEVKRAFISSKEQELVLDPFDPRFNNLILGIGLEVGFAEGGNPREYDIIQLLETVIHKCAPLFNQGGRQEMGVGLYQDRIYADIRSEFELFTDELALIPEEYGNLESRLVPFTAEMKQRYDAAVENRIVDPDDLELARKSARIPKRQSTDFEYEPSELENSQNEVACDAESDSTFCSRSQPEREKQIALILEEMERKHFYRDRNEVLEALNKCLGLCGKCLEGPLYAEKKKYCDRLIHWIPFGTMSSGKITSLFPRDNTVLRKCASAYHTVEDAEVALLFLPANEYRFRPDAEKSVEFELYPAEENPSPLMLLLHRLFAIHAEGTVKVFVRDNIDLSSLKEPLEVAMLYNKNVTKVEVYVNEESAVEATTGDLGRMVRDWSSKGYPPVTRKYIAPFSVFPYPKCLAKRDRASAIGDMLIENHFNWETNWANRDLNVGAF